MRNEKEVVNMERKHPIIVYEGSKEGRKEAIERAMRSLGFKDYRLISDKLECKEEERQD